MAELWAERSLGWGRTLGVVTLADNSESYLFCSHT